ncbi:hypothetical protein AURDEDRAFT_111323, partial [Auricularia subglabra TFB-10046 SS5]
MSPIIPSRKAFHQRLPSDDDLQKKQDGDPTGSSTELLSPARWKGKGKATEQDLDPGSDIGEHEHEREHGQGDSSEQLDGSAAGAAGTYPPTNEDEAESKRIEENLRRWEEAERQKRRAARESRLISAPNRTSVVEDAARGLTRLLSRSGPRRESVHNPHRPLRPTSDAEDGYALHRPESPSTPRPMTPGLSPASTAHPSPPTQPLSAAANASPFSDAHAATADPAAGPLMEPVSNPASVPPTPDETPQHPSRPVLPVQQSHL